MSRSRLTPLTALTLTALTMLIASAGCSRHTPAVPPPPASAPVTAAPPASLPTAPATPTAAFQPYTLLPAPPPAPPAQTHRHRVLHLTRVHNQVYLADSDRHLYQAGRDTQGHIYPIYRDPATHAAYPLLYDPARDNLYRVARNDDGRFYRNYVGQSGDQFYASDRDYERVTPSDDDRPVVTDSYNTYNYNTYNYGPVSYGDPYHRRPHPSFTGYKPPPAHSGSHHNNDWLWAIPVVIGVYLLLQPHHHAPPRPRPASPTTIIVRQTTPITIINQAPPPPAPRPIYSLPPAPQARRNAPPSAPPVRPAAFAPRLRPLRPQPVIQAHAPMPMPARPAFRRVHTAEPPSRPAVFRRPETFASRPVSVHHPARPTEQPPVTRTVSEPHPVVRAPERPRLQADRQPSKPRTASHDALRPASHIPLPDAPKPTSPPRHEAPRPAVRVEHRDTPRRPAPVARPIAPPPALSPKPATPLRPAPSPRSAPSPRPAAIPPRHEDSKPRLSETILRPEAPRKDRSQPDHAAKPDAKPTAPKKSPPVKAKKEEKKSSKPRDVLKTPG